MAYHPLSSTHSDFSVLRPIVEAIYEAAGGEEQFEVNVPFILRTAIDEVIDTPRTGRFLLQETEKTEKTYLGTKVEILIRSFLKFKKGAVLDMNIKGAEVDIKNTMGSTWSIPRENVGRPALLIRSNESTSLCDVGVAVLHDSYLNPGQNQDAKRSISAASAVHVWWLLRDHPYPVNFWALLTEADRKSLVAARGGTRRIAALFEMVQRRPISRLQVQGLAQQHDYMKRLRRNGGARDILARKGVAILSGVYDQEAIKQLDLGLVTREEFISCVPKDAGQAAFLRRLGHID